MTCCSSSADALLWLGLLALPVATVSWTVTHEELFREWREACEAHSTDARSVLGRKFFYVFTCEYCFSHYVAAGAVLATGFRLLLPDWRGAVIAWFALVAVANVFMSLFARLRVDIKAERLEILHKERSIIATDEQPRT